MVNRNTAVCSTEGGFFRTLTPFSPSLTLCGTFPRIERLSHPLAV
jgi:hypothetical protein